MNQILKDTISDLAKCERARTGFTQAEMAEELRMNTRAYIYIEQGIHGCSALTAVLLLLDCPNRDKVLADLKQKFSQCLGDEI